MAKKGRSKALKRLAAPKSMPITRKGRTWVVKPRAGPHPQDSSVALGVLLRDILHYADTLSEAKVLLRNREVLVDGRCVTDYRFPVGFMDVVSFPKIKKYYVMMFDRKGRIFAKDLPPKDANHKLCKVVRKMTGPKGKLIVGLHDGRVQEITQPQISVGDTVKVSIPEQSIVAHMPLAPGARCIVMGGKHIGEEAVVEELIPGTATREPEARLKGTEGSFVTVKKYLFVVG